MPLDPRRVKALDLADPAERTAFLDRECGDDNELRRRLDAGRFDRALPLLGDLAALVKQKAGVDSPRYSGVLAALGSAQLRANVARFRLFAGLTIDEAAEALGLSRATAFREWSYARSWLTTALLARKSGEEV